jgi:hypothetical protein
MCDDTAVKVWLGIAAGLVATAIALIIAAAVANGSFFGAWASPGLMLGAAAATGGAVVALGLAASAMQDYYDCLRRVGAIGTQCAGALANWMNNVAALKTVLGIQAAACVANAAIAWIPWGGQVQMWVILGALIAQAFLIASLAYFIVELNRCLPPSPPPPAGTRPVRQALARMPLWFPFRKPPRIRG